MGPCLEFSLIIPCEEKRNQGTGQRGKKEGERTLRRDVKLERTTTSPNGPDNIGRPLPVTYT